MLWRNYFDSNYDALLGSAPARSWHPLVVILLYYLYAIAGKFSVQVLPKHRNAPPPSMGAGLAQGGRSSLEKRISSEKKFYRNHGNLPAGSFFNRQEIRWYLHGRGRII
jgi:hypothetical protein